jgi:hypothetical protein
MRGVGFGSCAGNARGVCCAFVAQANRISINEKTQSSRRFIGESYPLGKRGPQI